MSRSISAAETGADPTPANQDRWSSADDAATSAALGAEGANAARETAGRVSAPAVRPSVGDDRCQVCGDQVRVQVLEGYLGGKPVVKRYCLSCADEAEFAATLGDAASDRRRLGVGSLLIVTGVIAGSVIAAADYLHGGGYGGIGVYQLTGILLGAFLVVLGALTRVDVMAILGTLAVSVAAAADVAGIGGAPGFGLRQQIGVACALVLIGAGFALRRRARLTYTRQSVDTSREKA